MASCLKKNRNDIPAGYQVTITSWENDADNYKDQVLSGLSEADAKFITKLAPLFKSGTNTKKNFGGSYDASEAGCEKMVSTIETLMKSHPDISKGLREKWTRDLTNEYWKDHLEESISELVSYPGEGYDFGYRRVFSSLVVHYFPQDVEDVTSKF